MAKRQSLGRGFEALLSSSSRPLPPASQSELRDLPVEVIVRGRYQPRVDMREETLAELAESIRAQGIVQPIVVRRADDGAEGDARYEIVAGERRWRAAQMAGLDTIPALIRDIPDEVAVAVALIENIQRENLNPIEEARALRQLVADFGMTHERASAAVGRSRAAVTNLLRLLELPEAVIGMLERRELDMGHARALLPVKPAERLVETARRAVREGWSVRQMERAVQRLAEASERDPGAKARQRKDPNIVRLENELGETLGAPVSIEHGKKGGRLVIRYYSVDELEGILSHIK